MTEVLRPGNLAGLRVERAIDQEPNLNALFFGEFGAGKTRLAGSADAVPALRPVLFVDIEGGTYTLRHTYPNSNVVRVKSWDEMQAVYAELYEGLHDYRTVVIDSLTEAQLFNMDEVMKKLEEMDPERANKQEDIASMLEWQKNAKQIRKFVRAFRDLPMTVIFTALLNDNKDKMTGKVVRMPMLPGKLGRQIPGMFDIVGFLSVKELEEYDEPQRVLQTVTTEGVIAKDRSGKLPPAIIDPTMQKIYDYAIGKGNS